MLSLRQAVERYVGPALDTILRHIPAFSMESELGQSAARGSDPLVANDTPVSIAELQVPSRGSSAPVTERVGRNMWTLPSNPSCTRKLRLPPSRALQLLHAVSCTGHCSVPWPTLRGLLGRRMKDVVRRFCEEDTRRSALASPSDAVDLAVRAGLKSDRLNELLECLDDSAGYVRGAVSRDATRLRIGCSTRVLHAAHPCLCRVPATLQRLCEVLLHPHSNYRHTSKLLSALDKLLHVSSSPSYFTLEHRMYDGDGDGGESGGMAADRPATPELTLEQLMGPKRGEKPPVDHRFTKTAAPLPASTQFLLGQYDSDGSKAYGEESSSDFPLDLSQNGAQSFSYGAFGEDGEEQHSPFSSASMPLEYHDVTSAAASESPSLAMSDGAPRTADAAVASAAEAATYAADGLEAPSAAPGDTGPPTNLISSDTIDSTTDVVGISAQESEKNEAAVSAGGSLPGALLPHAESSHPVPTLLDSCDSSTGGDSLFDVTGTLSHHGDAVSGDGEFFASPSSLRSSPTNSPGALNLALSSRRSASPDDLGDDRFAVVEHLRQPHLLESQSVPAVQPAPLVSRMDLEKAVDAPPPPAQPLSSALHAFSSVLQPPDDVVPAATEKRTHAAVSGPGVGGGMEAAGDDEQQQHVVADAAASPPSFSSSAIDDQKGGLDDADMQPSPGKRARLSEHGQ